eukprot:SAG11_NODE_6520_length_1296_cov_2.893066_1_plen_45_part_10
MLRWGWKLRRVPAGVVLRRWHGASHTVFIRVFVTYFLGFFLVIAP